MDAIGTHECVVLMTSSQVGKTEIINNVVGYYIDQDPSPILVIQPILDLAKAWSKDRLAPMIRDTPCLTGKVREVRSRDSDNTVLHKVFTGGHITMAGANSAASLSARPIRVVLMDEVDRYPASAGTEGDPVRLARKRANNFWNRRIVMSSTPTLKLTSRIYKEWLISDQRRYHVPCPHCTHEQHLVWAQVKWPEGEPAKAAYHCESCGTEWTEADRLFAIRHGRWIATAKGNGKTAGFHLNEIYSPWSTPADMARAFVDAKNDPDLLKTFINTCLGECWEDDAEKADAHALMGRLEDWAGEDAVPGEPLPAPADVMVVTCGVDVQDDRFEIERVGWGVGEESWSLDHKIIYGDPSGPAIWEDLLAYLNTPTQRLANNPVVVAAVAIDSGGHFTQTVYKFAEAHSRRRIWAVKGVGGNGRPVWPKRATKVMKGAANLFIVGVDAAKDILFKRLKVVERGPGYHHFPAGRDAVYFEQLTAEQVIIRKSHGFVTRVYELPAGKRNEALDCRVYAYAALQSLNVRWGALLAAAYNKPPTSPQAVKPVAQTSPQAEGGAIPPAPAPRQPTLGGVRPGNTLTRQPRGNWLQRK